LEFEISETKNIENSKKLFEPHVKVDPKVFSGQTNPSRIISEPSWFDVDYDNITGKSTDLLDWSISLSNRFHQDNKQKIYLAISCILFRDMIKR